MNVIVLGSPEQVGKAAGSLTAGAIESSPGLVLGVATGSSPIALYEYLAARVRAGQLNCSGLSAFALDEYVGIPASDPASYSTFINSHVTTPLRLNPDRVHVPDGHSADLNFACRIYEELILSAGGVDLQILGIGANGHIGFNEPGSSLGSRTHVEALTARTRSDNARFFDDVKNVPFHSITQGLATIMEAKKILLVATGPNKANALAAAIEGPVTASCPGSILQFHPNVTVVVDEAAAASLALTERYDTSLVGSA